MQSFLERLAEILIEQAIKEENVKSEFFILKDSGEVPPVVLDQCKATGTLHANNNVTSNIHDRWNNTKPSKKIPTSKFKNIVLNSKEKT